MCSTTHYQGWRKATFGSSWNNQSSWLSFFVWNSNYPTAMAASMLCPCPDLQAQPQLVLLSPTRMPTKFLCSFQLKGVLAIPGFLPSSACALPWALRCRAASMASLSLTTFSPTICSCLPTFRCFHASISQACLYVEQWILCWIIALQIIEISARPRGSLTPSFFWHQQRIIWMDGKFIL